MALCEQAAAPPGHLLQSARCFHHLKKKEKEEEPLCTKSYSLSVSLCVSVSVSVSVSVCLSLSLSLSLSAVGEGVPLKGHGLEHTPSTEGALCISAQLSCDAVSALRKVWVLIKLQALVYDILPSAEGAGKRCSECGYQYDCRSNLAPKHTRKHETHPPRVKRKGKKKKKKKKESSVSIQTIVILLC